MNDDDVVEDVAQTVVDDSHRRSVRGSFLSNISERVDLVSLGIDGKRALIGLEEELQCLVLRLAIGVGIGINIIEESAIIGNEEAVGAAHGVQIRTVLTGDGPSGVVLIALIVDRCEDDAEVLVRAKHGGEEDALVLGGHKHLVQLVDDTVTGHEAAVDILGGDAHVLGNGILQRLELAGNRTTEADLHAVVQERTNHIVGHVAPVIAVFLTDGSTIVVEVVVHPLVGRDEHGSAILSHRVAVAAGVEDVLVPSRIERETVDRAAGLYDLVQGVITSRVEITLGKQ